MNRQEIKYILFAAIFALVVFGYIIPYVINGNIGNISPVVQFLFFNISIFIFLQVFLKATTTGSKISISGTVGLIALFMAIDIWQAPLMVSMSGELLSGPMLSGGATDYIIGLLFINMGMKGFLVYFMTFVTAPIILLLISARLIPNFVRSL